MAPIRGKPFLDLLLEYLLRQGVTRVVFCVGHLRERLQERYAHWPEMQTVFSIETEPLGTAGAVRGALQQVATERFYVLNGDSFCDVALPEMLRHHIAHRAVATLTAAPLEGRIDAGALRLDSAGRVVSFREKALEADTRASYMNAGVYLLERSAFDGVAPGQASLEYELIPRWIANGSCYGFVTTAEVVDIGTPDRYARAQERL
jgi:NDP-sugar pyrophosphorylase family protein